MCFAKALVKKGTPKDLNGMIGKTILSDPKIKIKHFN